MRPACCCWRCAPSGRSCPGPSPGNLIRGPLLAALYTQVTPAQIGTAAGLFRTSIYIGSIASATITSLVFRTQISDHGLHQIAVILIAASVVILLMTLADRRIRARPRVTIGQPDAATARKSPVPGRP